MKVMRDNAIYKSEIKEIIIADVALIVAFAFALSGGLFSGFMKPGSFIDNFVYVLPIVAVGVTMSFILHEMMHKFVAQHYGAIAGFKSSMSGLLITLATGMFGFILGIPGATMIYTRSFTKRENGIVSLAGPLTNFVIFGVFLAIGVFVNPPIGSYLFSVISFTIYISILLAFFNMLPIFPLDGSKVLSWNIPVYILIMGIIAILIFAFGIMSITNFVYMILIALVISSFFRIGMPWQ